MASIWDAAKQYFRDAMPGGALNPEVSKQGILDTAAISLSPVPLLGDAVGLLADANRYVTDPRSRTPENYGLSAVGLLPFVPSMAGIVKPSVARKLGVTPSLPKSEEFARAVQNTPGAQILEDGLQMNIMRNQLPEQGMQQSVRGGVFYLPEGAAQAKHYSTGKNGYGGSERIAGETLIQNPVFVKGATGGKAPEAAFDQLAGKGAYQAMRDDALKITMAWGKTPGQKVADVEAFLSKYAPEMKGMGDYIIDSSRKGNQLPYALQEAAVASKVRGAGHDVVLGYSKGRNGKGEFLSEVFDVRESLYPDKFGGYGLFEQFDKGLLK